MNSEEQVFVETYEVVGGGRGLANKFVEEQRSATEAHWAIVRRLGAKAYRPSHDGGIRSLFFKMEHAPIGFRKIDRDDNLIECVPNKATKTGKVAAMVFAKAPCIPSWRSFADNFGWEGRSPVFGSKIYFASGVQVFKPRERVFIRVPRTLKDGWKPPATLKEVRESDMLRAIEDHNLVVRKKEKVTNG